MTDKKVIREFSLMIKHYDGDQTKEELQEPCKNCLFCNFQNCLLFEDPIRKCQRKCISNYRIDIETFVDAMRRKIDKDCDDFKRWIESFPKYMKPEDGELLVIRSPEDIIRVHEELKKNGEL